MDADVVIVGAGAAGIGAALELRQRGVSCLVLEAAERVGGRAFTDTASLPGYWDHGCQWLHCADVNPLVAWADRLGADYDRTQGFDDHLFWRAGRWLDADERQVTSDAVDAGFARVYGAAAAGADRPVSAAAGDSPAHVLYILRLMACSDLDRVSTIGYAEYEDTAVNWRVRSGLGRLIAGMAEGLPLRLATPVTAVDQGVRQVRVTTPHGTLSAKAVIVTCSTNVLTSGAIAFSAGPARDLLEDIGQVPCGNYEKVAVAVSRLPAEVAATTGFTGDPADGTDAPFFQVVGGDHPKIILHMAGTLARDLAAAGRNAMADFAIGRMAQIFGGGFRSLVQAVAATAWEANPLIRGGYSYARVGASDARRRMIGADTGRVAFAGEAFSPRWQATAHGAYQSGRDVAARVQALLA